MEQTKSLQKASTTIEVLEDNISQIRTVCHETRDEPQNQQLWLCARWQIILTLDVWQHQAHAERHDEQREDPRALKARKIRAHDRVKKAICAAKTNEQIENEGPVPSLPGSGQHKENCPIRVPDTHCNRLRKHGSTWKQLHAKTRSYFHPIRHENWRGRALTRIP